METIPEGLIVNAQGFGATGQTDVMKPTYGRLGMLPAVFKVEEVYSASDSVEAGEEIKRKVEICEIHVDKFSKVPLRVANVTAKVDNEGKPILDQHGKPVMCRIKSELTRDQEIKLAPLYEQFKKQKDSTDTSIVSWQAINDNERNMLGQLGIWSVEQLNAIPQYDRYKLGPAGEELWERSERHRVAKEGRKQREATDEMLMVLEENKKARLEMAEMREELLRLQAEASGKKPSTQTKVPLTAQGKAA